MQWDVMVTNGVNAGEVGNVKEYVDEPVLGVRLKEAVTGGRSGV